MGLGSSLLHGPPPALPEPVDRLAERWARQPPRLRLAAWLMAVVILATQCSSYRDGLAARWGGEGTTVWQATRTVAAGEDPRPALRRVALPPVALPPDPVGDLPAGTVLVLPLLEGAVLTEGHLTPVGLAAGLPEDQRLLPVPVEATWGIQPGVVVDVWAIDPRRGPPVLLAGGRPVLAVQGERGRQVALLVLDADAVGTATEVLTTGQVRLALSASPD